MNIVHLVFSFTTGGIENLLVDILNNWSEEDNVLLCIVNDRIDYKLLDQIKTSDKIKCICLNREPGTSKYKSIVELNQILCKFHPNVLHCHSNNVFLFALPIKLIHPSWNMYLTIHDTKIYNTNSKIKRLLHRLFLKKIFAISASVKRDIIAGGFPESRIVIVYNGIDETKFIKTDEKHNNDVKRIICVARIVPEKKGQDILIRACSLLAKKKIPFDCVFVGEPPTEHPEYLENLRSLVHNLQIDEQVHFLGNRNDVPRMLSESDIFVLPSRYEGFGIAIVEAMMAKIPVIASNLDGPREILEGGYGYLFDVGNDKKLANLLEQIISGKIENNLVENAYMHAIDLFSIDRMILCMRNAYCQ